MLSLFVPQDSPVNDDYYTAEAFWVVTAQNENALVIQLLNRGQPLVWEYSRYNTLEHAEAEAEHKWANLKEINGCPIITER